MKKTLLLMLMMSISIIGRTAGLHSTASATVLNDSLPEVTVSGSSICPGESFDAIFTVKNFEDIQGMQFTVTWNPDILRVNPSMKFIDPHFDNMQFNVNEERGRVEIAWYGSPLSMDDDEVFMRVNFKAIGNGGDMSPFTFVSNPTPVEFTKLMSGTPTLIGSVVNGDMVYVTAPVITESNITNTTAGQSNGAIDVTVDYGTAPYNFEWNNGATTEDLTDLATGNYRATITDANGCRSVTDIFKVDLLSSAGEPESLENFSLSPNPTSNGINLQASFSQTEKVSASLYTTTGILLWQAAYQAKEINTWINLDHLSNGMYFLELRTEEGRATRKLLHQ